MNRQDKYNKYFMRIAKEISQLSQCLSRKVGCVIISQLGSLISSGFNGNMPHTPHCNETGICIRKQQINQDGTWKFAPAQHLNMCLAVHAEQNALMQICKNGGTSTRGASIYCTTFPCTPCLKLIVSAGIEKVFYNEEYKDEMYEIVMEQLKGKIEFTKVEIGDDDDVT